ncbi:uncharacterized protein [Asterias amurensis]|uniref:uncharacterized protein isoform X2 n=1 Tax=Asterias amurensis TaxID=7602 RepID=UPI003AB3235F
MSNMESTPPFRMPKRELPAKLKVKEPDGYLSVLAGGKSPISMPPIPAWMLNTPMYSKLPMIPAPKGKITLYTTGLGEKLYRSPSDLDFDPSAEGLNSQGLNSQYRCLHDPHLKTHYNQSASFKDLVKKKFITPEGKVVCTLKEFNEYHQYLKRIHIEKLAHGRKRTAERQRRDRERQRQEWSNKEELSPHDKHLIDVQMRRRKLLKEQHKSLTQRLEADAVKHLRLLKEVQAKHCIEEARSKLEKEKKRNKKIRMEMEEIIKRAKKRKKQTEEERKHAELLKCYRIGLKDSRQLKLEDQWNRHKHIRDKRLVDDSRRKKQEQAEIEENIRTRQEIVADQRSRQLSTFENIRDTRASHLQQQEVKIRARLEKKLKIVRNLLEQRRRRQTGGRRRRHHARHGLGGPRHYSAWAVDCALERIKLSPADGVWKFDESLLLMNAQTTSPVTSVSIEPSLDAETKEPSHIIISGSQDIIEEVDEDDLNPEITEEQAFSLSSLELAVLFGDHYDSFIASSRDLIGNVFQALEAERFSTDSILPEPRAAESEVRPPEVKLPEVMRQKSVLHLANSRVARLVVSTILNRAKEQIDAEGGLPPLPGSTATASDSMLPSATEISPVGRLISLPDMHPASPIAKSEVISDGFLPTRGKEKSSSHTSSSLLARAVVSDALRNAVQGLEEETHQSDTSILAEEVVWDAIRCVTSQLHHELSQSGTSVIAERVVSDAMREAAQQLRAERPMHSRTSLLAEDLAFTAIKNATNQLRMLLPQSSSSIIAEAVAADAIKNVMRELGADPLKSSSSIIAQAFASDALKNATRRLEADQTLQALYPQVHTSSSLLAQAVANNTVQKVTRQLQQENRALQPHTDSSLIAESVTNDALANAMRHLGRRLPSPVTDSSLLAQAVTRDTLQNATVQLQAEKRLHTPKTSSSILAHDVMVNTLQNAVAQIAGEEATQPHIASSSPSPQAIADDALKAAKEQLRTEQRANSRSKSRSSSPFSPEPARSVMNQTSPQPAQQSLKARAVVSDIIKRTSIDTDSPSPTEGGLQTPPPSPAGQPLKDVAIDTEDNAGSGPRIEESGIDVQAQTVVKLVFSSVIAYLSQALEYPRDEAMIQLSQSEGKVHDGHDVHVHRSSILLATVNDVFRESEEDLEYDHVEGSESEESDMDEEDDEQDQIIGLVENEIIAEEESVHSLAECLEGLPVEGLTSVVKKNQEKMIFEGAVIPREGVHEESVTEKVLSMEELHPDESGHHLVHDISNKSLHKVAESGEYSEDGSREAKSHHFSSIVPIYHSHPLNLDEEIISHNLSAISMKPDSHRKVPSAYSANSRNSFRNVFRPDMTFCQGSAKCLKDTLVQELTHPHHEDHDHIYGVLDQPNVDITEHHSDEEFMGVEESGGVCYLPKRKAYKVHEVVDDVVTEEQEDEQRVTARAGEEASQPSAPQDHKEAGGDCTSPHEDEVEPPVPVSRASTRSIRSGKSRDSPCLRSESESRGSPAEMVSNSETKTSDGRKPSEKASHSRSMIGAVISRISSIFGRKTSKIHTESKTKTASIGASSSSTHSQDPLMNCAPKTEGSKPGDSLHITDVSARDLTSNNQVSAPVSESTTATDNTTAEVPYTKGDEDNPNISKQQAENTDETNLETIDDKSEMPEQKVEQEVTDPAQPDAQQVNQPFDGPTLSDKVDEVPVTLLTADDNITVKQVISSNVKLESTADENNQDTEELGQTKSKTLPKMDNESGKPKAFKAKVKSSLTRHKSSFEKRQRGKKKKSKSGVRIASDPCVKRTTSSKSAKSRPFLSLTRNLSRSSTKSSSPLGYHRQQSPRKSPISPRPKEDISTKPSDRQPRSSGSNKTTGHAKITCTAKPTSDTSDTATNQPPADARKKSSAHESSQPIIKQHSESSAPIITKRGSLVSNPPSTGSVRLIKVTPAPSMSSRSRANSTGSLKKISGHNSGGSVRLIKVSPAASTAIGPRRTPRQSPGSSAKTSPAPSPRASSRPPSGGSIGRKEKAVNSELPSHQKLEEARQSSGTHQAVEKEPSAGSFVVINTPTEIPNDVSGMPSGYIEVSADLGVASDVKDQPVGQDQVEAIQVSRPNDESGFNKTQSPDEEHKPTNEPTEVQTEARVENQGQDLPGVIQGKEDTSGPASVDEQAPPHSDQTIEGRHQPDDEVPETAVAAHRSKSVITAVIDRLSRMFSGQSQGSRTTDKGNRLHSETTMSAAVKSDHVIRQDEGGLHQSQSTGTQALSTEPVLSGKKKRKHKNKGKGTNSREGGSKTSAHVGGSHLSVPPNSSASDATSTANVTPAITAQISTVNSTNLPPVEAVETTVQPSAEGEVISAQNVPDDTSKGK